MDTLIHPSILNQNKTNKLSNLNNRVITHTPLNMSNLLPIIISLRPIKTSLRPIKMYLKLTNKNLKPIKMNNSFIKDNILKKLNNI